MEAKAGGAGVAELAMAFHAAAVGAVVEAVRLAGEGRVVLSGGCFQNRLLTEGVLRGLRSAGVRVIWHRWVPPNDGGIALGQVVAAMQRAG
jgi:hydrogenase maturation protein HypF